MGHVRGEGRDLGSLFPVRLAELIPEEHLVRVIADFRRLNGAGVRGACALFVQFCRHAGLLGGEWVAIDGSKFQAVASTSKALTREQLRRERARPEARLAWGTPACILPTSSGWRARHAACRRMRRQTNNRGSA